MSSARQESTGWHRDVPGSRWFRADLHVHTIDDLPGGKARLPAGLHGDPADPVVLGLYSREVLRGAVRAGVHVLGLTPHSPRSSAGPEGSAVWQIIDTWNTQEDDDGVPFRDKVYAVFPGFEPNVNDGGAGVHLLFLFDPEIGRDRYLRLFEAVMDGCHPWESGGLRLTPRDAQGVFDSLDARRDESRSDGANWDYLVLAPHFQGEHGILRELKSQVLRSFPCERLTGYELGDGKLPEDFNPVERPGLFLLPFAAEHRQGFFHASDAYRIAPGPPGPGDLGHRTTWVKLAAPRIEALRQAFLASDSRVRIAYTRGEDGGLRPIPEPTPVDRPWLRRVTIRGEASFFGRREPQTSREATIEFSPDLTCIIGGSMTGKSTLLDGLRTVAGLDLPRPGRLRDDVQARGTDRFLAGRPEVFLDTPGRGNELPKVRWPAIFFTQNELQELARDESAVVDILARLVPGERAGILQRQELLAVRDRELDSQAKTIVLLLEQRSAAEQALEAARRAAKALEDFNQAGLATMQASERSHGRLGRLADRVREANGHLADAFTSLEETEIEPEFEHALLACVTRLAPGTGSPGLVAARERSVGALRQATEAIRTWAAELQRLLGVTSSAVATDRQVVERKLAELGYGAEKLAEFQALSRGAGLLSSYEVAFADASRNLEDAVRKFEEGLDERTRSIREQREAIDRVREAVSRRFADRIRVARIDCGSPDALGALLLGFKQKGITQWWNDLPREARPSPEVLYQKLEAHQLDSLGVSRTVAERFEEVFDEARRFELRAVRSPDRYQLSLRVEGGEYRESGRLSGGKRVSLLLSLMLEAHDERPLVIDQPEDELDNRFLWETVLPALRRLKGRRQVIVATHNANIVVNGDADLVVLLEADADHGRVAVAGAIEEPAVRKAILETVDGGEDAFELRKAKYGF